MTVVGVTFGMTPQQLQRRLGKPAQKQGRCWLYPIQEANGFAAYGVVKSEEAICFFGGVVSDYSRRDYVRRHTKLVLWKPPAPKLP